MQTNDERREIAAMLRDMCIYGCSWKEEFYDLLGEAVMDESSVYEFSDVADRLADLIEPEPIDGDTSDGYHTFNELYDHRAKLFSVVVAAFSNNAWKSKRHSDGSMYEGMFIVGIDTPHGQATYHYEIEPYWELFHCSELSKAPEWDGHTPTQAIDRIASLADLIDPAEHERTVADNLALIERNRELERELARAKRKLGRTRRQGHIDHERAVLADQLEDENLELKKRLGCFDDVTPPVSWYSAMRERCERLERELAEADRHLDD